MNLASIPSPVSRMHALALRIHAAQTAGNDLPEDLLHELLVGVHIVDVVHQRVPLTKQGGEYVALCPFHIETLQSFTVSSLQQIFHCFGCGAHGTALDFLQRHGGVSRPEAIIDLLAHYGGVDREVALSAWLTAGGGTLAQPSATATTLLGGRA